MDETRFDALKVGDRIYWARAVGEAATVTEVLSNDGTVWIAWESMVSGETERHTTSLRWKSDERVVLADVCASGS